MESFHLDNHTVAKPSDFLLSQMAPFAKRHWKSVSFEEGVEPFVSIRKAKERIETLFGKGHMYITADPISHLYTAAYGEYILPSGKNQIITPDPLHLEKLGCVAKWGEEVEKLITPRTAMISLPWAQNGLLYPIRELAKLDVLVHVDVSEVVGKHFFQFEELGIDFITFSATPFHGPKGIGGIISKEPLDIPEGEPNLPALIGLGVACEEAIDNLDHLALETSRLRNMLEKLGQPQKRDLPHIANIVFPGLDPELIQFALAKKGVFVGRTKTAVSFALTRDTTEEEIVAVIGIIEETVNNYESILEPAH